MLHKKIALTLVAVFVFASAVNAQNDTVRIFQYNLLNYGDNNNPASYKNARLATITQYAEPDIIAANEIANSSAHSQNILDNVLGVGWTKGTFTNTGNEIQTNMLFWKTDKFALKYQKSISYKLRDIIAFNLYYKDAMLEQTKDTIFLTIIIAHLKAGNSTQNQNDRTAETQTVVNYLNSLGKTGNYIFMGDFNLYSSNEQAYLNLVNNPNAAGRLYDPISRPGNWSASSSFADIHTQSTRTSNMPDGGSSGGLDDRFDHILVSDDLLHDKSGCVYLQGSYTTLGQDGKHFNKAVTASPANANVPAQVIQSLYEMSDHLPVYADFIIHPSTFPANVSSAYSIKNIDVVNPFQNKLIFIGSHIPDSDFAITVYSATGSIVLNEKMNIKRNNNLEIPGNWKPGTYIIKIQDANYNIATKKLIKQ